APAPLIREQDLGAVVAEGGGVPVGEVRVRDGDEALRVHRVADVEQQAVALARAARQADGRIDRDVVALRGAVVAAVRSELRGELRQPLPQGRAVRGGRRAG